MVIKGATHASPLRFSHCASLNRVVHSLNCALHTDQAPGGRTKLMRRRRFEALVREALTTLPPDLRRLMDNVEIVVEDSPTDEDLAAAGLGPDETLFGLYLGVPLTERTSGYTLALPDKIIICQGPLEACCPAWDELV